MHGHPRHLLFPCIVHKSFSCIGIDEDATPATTEYNNDNSSSDYSSRTVDHSYKRKQPITETWYAAKYFVKQRLKFHSSADFPWGTYKYGDLDDDVYIIKSYIDAENSFGITLRRNFTIKVKYTGGDKDDYANWQEEGYNMEGE